LAVPFGREAVPTASGMAVTVSEYEADLLNARVELSEAAMLKVKEPEVVGVPERVPVVASSARPAGSFPDPTLQVYGAVPPVAVKATEYGESILPAGREAGEIDIELEAPEVTATLKAGEVRPLTTFFTAS
jgi:hypothetical protein